MAAGIAIQAKGGDYLQSYLPLLDSIEIGSTRMGFLLRAVAGIVITTGIFSIAVSLLGIVGACKRIVVLLIIVSILVELCDVIIMKIQRKRKKICLKKVKCGKEMKKPV